MVIGWDIKYLSQIESWSVGVMECRRTGVLEYWSTGVLVKHKKRPLTVFPGFFHYSNTPSLHHSLVPPFYFS
jgi:hypothetical protein